MRQSSQLLALLVSVPVAVVVAADYHPQVAAPAAHESQHARAGSSADGQLRQPTALVLSADGRWLYAANQRSGSISVIDVVAGRVAAEHRVGRRLADLQQLTGERLLAVDEGAHELIVLRARGPRLSVTERLPVAKYPVSVVASQDGRTAYVASLWSRRVSVVSLGPPGKANAAVTRTIDLPLAPREQLLLADRRRLIVADNFGGRLGVIDTDAERLLFVREFPAHNIRGLRRSTDGKYLLVTHQMLSELAHTVRTEVHWGIVMSNDLRWLRLDTVLDPKIDIFEGAHIRPLGQEEDGGADPGEFVVLPDGRLVITLAGAGKLALGREGEVIVRRAEVGRNPAAIVAAADGRRAFVANRLEDTIAVFDLEQSQVMQRIALGPVPAMTAADRGERVFHNARLSHDSWMSCQSCHTGGHTNGLLNDNFSDGSFGAPKRVLPLGGVTETAPYAWNGETQDLAEQIKKSVRVTMQGSREPSRQETRDLIAFLATLDPPPSLADARGDADLPARQRGRVLFKELNCVRCHRGESYTSPRNYDVGLHDKLGNRRFNPPSLRGVRQRDALFHDGRAKSLRQVVEKYRHQLRRELSPREADDLVEFLRGL